MTGSGRPGGPAGLAVLVVVGTDSHPFDRLMGWLERWYVRRADRPRLLVQHGSSRVPRIPGARAYLAHEQMQRAMREAVLVVTHGGPATITEARRTGHLPIVVPRDPAHAEHVDDHQLRFAHRLSRLDTIRLCESEPDLAAALDRGLAEPAAFALPEPAAPGPAGQTAVRVGRIVEDLVELARQRRNGRGRR
ncbi:glycosyltransferase [Micromonospora sp. NPDC049559]|uniref:glycosyltransferase n=1 Tax=Micromonospora sp. NPDC049559 TaxID=3155923 RepID=UPI0034424930